MNFLDVELKPEYRTLHDNVVADFLNPALERAILYKRATGYFSSAALAALSDGIFSLVNNGGTIRLIISPQLSEEDLAAIEDGFSRCGEVTLTDLTTHAGSFDKQRLNLLSNLIALGVLEIKIAEIESDNGFGRFNAKFGLLQDTAGNVIAFSGSMNESANGFANNYDSIDVFASWTSDVARVRAKEEAFDLLWNNREPGVRVSDFNSGKVESTAYEDMSKIKSTEKILTLVRKQRVVEYVPSDLLQHAEKIFERQRHCGEYSGVPTGFSDLDEVTNGFQRGNTIILAAKPSMGKTALAMNIAMRAARDVPVLIFSLEMSKGQLMNRVYSSFSGVNLTRIINGTLKKEEDDALDDVMGLLGERKFAIDDTGDLSISELKMRARQFKHKRGLGLVVIDCIQLIQGSKEYQGNRAWELGEISRGLKSLAKELDVPVLAVSQLDRKAELRLDKKPQLLDLPEPFEDEADIVMFLHREEYNNLAELIIAKNRNGVTTSVMLHFDAETVRFRDLTLRGR